MNIKEFFHKWVYTIKQWWKTGLIQRTSRITYDVVWNVILFFIIIGVIGLFFGGGLGAGYFASLVKDEAVRAEEEMKDAIYNYSETSEIYFDNNVYMGEVSSDLYREEIALKEVSPWVIDAIVATEDASFYEHKGVVPKAVLRAMFQEVTNASVKTGGSTLTQQIIKNQILTNEVSFERKAKEILLALRAEQFLKKEDILEVYLNVVPFGRNANGQNIAGIHTAAQGIFGVDAKDLNLPQSAFIAGLPQSPFAYTPFKNGGQVKEEEGLKPGLSRMRTVLSRMLEAGSITQEEFDEAINYDIISNLAKSSSSIFEKYPYLTLEVKDRATELLRDKLAIDDGYSMEDIEKSNTLKEEYTIKADRSLSQGGYKIHTTINKEIYDVFQKITKDYNNYGVEKVARNPNTGEVIKVENDNGEKETLVQPVQTGSVLIDNATGKIISFVGGRDFDIAQLNHATNNPRSIGSTAKPLLVYGPAMEEGKVQPGSIIADLDIGPYRYIPSNYVPGRYYGLVTAREALYKSHNVTAAKIYQDILNLDPVGKYFAKMGFSNITDVRREAPSMALGVHEATVEENVNGFATFGNGGNFVDAYMIESIESIDGEKVYQHESEPVEVFTPQTNYLMLDMMRDVLRQGTATYARANLSNPSVDWAGKTGTGNDYTDAWFVATNPNVTMGTWIGYDYRQKLDKGYSGRNQLLWAKLVNAATKIDPDLMAPSNRFERPSNIVSRSFCKTSGLLPSDICRDLGLVGSDIYNAKYIPEKEDNSLVKGRYAIVDGQAILAGENTPSEFVQEDGIAFNPEWLEENDYDELDNISKLFPGNSSMWSDINVPAPRDEIKNDGKAPNAPSSLKKAGKRLAWSKSSSNDTVGYRIYRAADPDSAFRLIGRTTDTDYNIANVSGVYTVKAVDYFGQESTMSINLEVGDFSSDGNMSDNNSDDNMKPTEEEDEQ
ncbi:Penicillin-binding protein 1A [Paraliobacillus sp. PM-2]|uniref:transglycosylase domain-containing protein n=1 Tax=Paraliobacillus sp. PM-2 TaxID=1462524 RepID=UPI00061CAEA8|nr:transglycosylase domain-containing protein [Paraliobacillus sp. PM-2]CQR48156.1 Penicillin-binding protein 1A [Paraliobacillus sp. PM-2]